MSKSNPTSLVTLPFLHRWSDLCVFTKDCFVLFPKHLLRGFFLFFCLQVSLENGTAKVPFLG